MFCYKKIQMLLLIAVLNMTFPAQGHKILDLILTFPASHTSGYNMMNIYSLPSTHFARYIVIRSIFKIIKVDFCMLLHIYKLVLDSDPFKQGFA